MMEDLTSVNFTADLSAVAVPALIVYGDIDHSTFESFPIHRTTASHY